MEPALRLLTIAPPPGWLTLAEAADRLGLSPGHARRCAAEEWSAAGTARLHDGAWIVHPTADLRLAGIETHRQRDLRQLAALRRSGARPRDLEIAEARRDIVIGFEVWLDEKCPRHLPGAWRDRDAIASYLAHCRATGVIGDAAPIARCAVSTFYAWRAAYERPDDAGGLRALSGRQGRSSGESESVGAAAWAHCRCLLLAGNNIRVATAWTLTRGEATKHPGDPDWAWPALRTIQRKAQLEIPRPLRILANKGERAFRANCLPKGECDDSELPSNVEWVGDERTFDVMLRIRTSRGWRPCREIKVTAWIDRRSRLVTGYMIAPHADSNTILGSLKRGIAAHGKPQRLRVDWGHDYQKAGAGAHKRWSRKDFDGQRISGVLERLGIAVHPVTPYTPWAKLIESFFRTVKEHFDKLLESFWGGCPDERHEDRQCWVQSNLEKLPTLEQFESLFAQHLDTYHRTPHSAESMFSKSPLDAHAAFRDGPAQLESDDVLEFLFCDFSDKKKVRRDGIKHLGCWYGHGDERLVAMQGQTVLLAMQPDDASRAWVCALDGTPLGFQIECVSNRFATKRDAERLARMRARLTRPYRDQVREARDWFEAQTPAALLDSQSRAAPPAASAAPSLRLVTARPELSAVLASAAAAASEADSNEPQSAFEDALELEDIIIAPPPRAAVDDADDDEGPSFVELSGETYE